MQEDVEHLLRILKLQNDIKFPSARVNVTSSNSMLDWFRSVPLEDREKLYQIYEKDFKLFGYERPDTLLSAWQQLTTQLCCRLTVWAFRCFWVDVI